IWLDYLSDYRYSAGTRGDGAASRCADESLVAFASFFILASGNPFEHSQLIAGVVETDFIHDVIDQIKPATVRLKQAARVGRIGNLAEVETRTLVGDDEACAFGGELGSDQNGFARIA